MTSQELEAPLVSREYEEIDSIEMPQPNQCPESQDGNTGFAEPYVTEDDELSYTQLWFQTLALLCCTYGYSGLVHVDRLVVQSSPKC